MLAARLCLVGKGGCSTSCQTAVAWPTFCQGADISSGTLSHACMQVKPQWQPLCPTRNPAHCNCNCQRHVGSRQPLWSQYRSTRARWSGACCAKPHEMLGCSNVSGSEHVQDKPLKQCVPAPGGHEQTIQLSCVMSAGTLISWASCTCGDCVRCLLAVPTLHGPHSSHAMHGWSAKAASWDTGLQPMLLFTPARCWRSTPCAAACHRMMISRTA